MTAANGYTDDVLARLQEYFSLGAPWQRSLWSVGPAFALRELIESADGVQNGALSTKALKRHAESVGRMLSNNPAAGEPGARRELLALMARDLSAGGVNYQELQLWLKDVEEHTLNRWAVAVDQPDKPSREQFARAIACELFRAGFSAQRLQPWIVRMRTDAEVITEQDLVNGTQSLIAQRPEDHEVLLTFEQPLPRNVRRPPEAIDAPAVATWLTAHGFGRIRQHGGLLLKIEARDRYTAAQLGADIGDRLQARAAVGTRKDLSR